MRKKGISKVRIKSGCLYLCLFLLLQLMVGCGAIDYFFLKSKPQTPRELLEAGNESMLEKDYSQAVDYFSKLKERFPFSPYAPQAELGLADAYFLSSSFYLAEDAYKEFESLHPGSKDLPYVLYQIGECNFKQFTSIDLPQENVTEALEYYNKVLQLAPSSPYGKKAKEKIEECRKIKAHHELFVANFYFRTKRYHAAWQRFDFVCNNYPEFVELNQYAGEMRKLAYFRYQEQHSEKVHSALSPSWFKKIKDWL